MCNATGNNIAQLDPLGINDADLDSAMPPELLTGDKMDQDQVKGRQMCCEWCGMLFGWAWAELIELAFGKGFSGIYVYRNCPN